MEGTRQQRGHLIPRLVTTIVYAKRKAVPVSVLTVLVGEDVGEENLSRIRVAHPEVELLTGFTREAFLANAPTANIVFTKQWPEGALETATNVSWIQAGTAGIERILRSGVAGRGDIVLTNASGVHGIPMSENILAMMLSFAIRLHTMLRGQSDRLRPRDLVIETKFELEGQTLCVLGLGDIGGTLACKAQALGMRVLGVRRTKAEHPCVDESFPSSRLLEALPQADHVALCLPLTRETRAIVGERELRAMKESAYIYNVGRGASIDATALLAALQEGWIAGAGLDVTDPEPLPDDSPMWDMPNVILSQHTSGSSPYNAERITSVFLDNLDRYLAGEPLVNVIDKVLGY